MNASAPFDSLVEISGNPKPFGISVGTLAAADRVRLRYAVAPARAPKTRGTVILLQGRNEAIEKYFETIDDLTARGYMVATFDWRGQGGSQRTSRNPSKGHVARFDSYRIDLEAVFRDVVLPDCRGPYAILAHSMGATVAILAAPTLYNRVERIVASAPMIALAGVKPRTNQIFYASSLLKWTGLGSLNVRNGVRQSARYTLAKNPLTTDRRRFERNRRLAEAAPHLFVGGPTAGWLAAASQAMRRLDDSDVIAAMRVPTLVVTAGADAVVSSAAAERLAWRMRSGHALEMPGARHELLQEADRFREPFLAAFDAFAGGALPAD
ncbi:alpha/beta fold hydrolase [Aureimonas leprariae]|uniref:Alpha/beta hydrolase n=1 Tax=Plantimonas leprariae TaxID=2615207 RepID=A0A7V7PMZ8_9HYPH|nr:alpha/beta hydrolase [Aureimonas leprariae]KAB0678781.1 alpha/beta hydrolase [Aureimonas leprariae]